MEKRISFTLLICLASAGVLAMFAAFSPAPVTYEYMHLRPYANPYALYLYTKDGVTEVPLKEPATGVRTKDEAKNLRRDNLKILTAKLHELSQQGWEVVELHPISDPNMNYYISGADCDYVLRRPL